MDLSYGAEYEAYRAEVRAFLEAHWSPRGAEAERSREEQVRRFRSLATERGYLYRNIPRRYGGSEQDPDVLRAQILREEFGRARAPMEVAGNGLTMLVPTLLDVGEEWQREYFVPKTVTGEYRWCQGYSEPGAGSDLASLRTRAELVGDEWVIHGQKIWTSFAREATFMFALVRTEPDAPKHAGITYMLIPMQQPGIEVRPLKQITGDAEFAEVFFDAARTPASWIVGRRGEGWQVSRTTLKHERNVIGASDRSSGLFESLLRLARKVDRDGQPAIRDPLVRDQLASLLGYVKSQEYSAYVQLTREHARGDSAFLQMCNKLGSTNIAQEVARIALGLVGSESLLAPPVPPGGRAGNEKWMNQFLGSLGISIAGGTSNVQRNIIAERGLGLPRDPYASSR